MLLKSTSDEQGNGGSPHGGHHHKEAIEEYDADWTVLTAGLLEALLSATALL